jgi:hypothetical protein
MEKMLEHETRFQTKVGAEQRRLEEDAERKANWKRWGTYLAERQWGTVREDYSAQGHCWEYFPHDQARSRAYRWGEDGLFGLTDRECRLCFAVTLWNGKDPILKERLFGLTGPEGNHGEDVKELYYYLDATPTHSYAKGLYKYPQREYPYEVLREAGRQRSKAHPELEIQDTGAFDENRYFDVATEYAKSGPDDILIRITLSNRGPEASRLDVLPTLWFRNTWSWGCAHDGCTIRPRIRKLGDSTLATTHETLGENRFFAGPGPDGTVPEWLFTENESNAMRLWGVENASPYVKDAFDRYVVRGEKDAVNPKGIGTKAAAHYRLTIPAGESVVLQLRLTSKATAPAQPFDRAFDDIFERRLSDADEFYASIHPAALTPEERRVQRQAYAGMLWSKQFFHYAVKDWLEGDPSLPSPPQDRKSGRNSNWKHLFNRDLLSMPDKWEYPWYAAWDLAFHMIPFARLDPQFAKDQLVLMLREWYMHPNGQIPAYEFAFDDVNPPVHAWACWRVYKMTGPRGQRDLAFLTRVFHKLMINFTWWVNRKDPDGKNLFAGGFLGLDNIGVFDRSRPLPTGGQLAQADGTAWMAFYCSTMLSIALELARHDRAYEDVASKFFEHFVGIADAINSFGGTGLWDEEDGFYYDQLHCNGSITPLRIRSMVGLIPLFAVEVLETETLDQLPGFTKRMEWFLKYRKNQSWQATRDNGHLLLAIPLKERLVRVVRYLLDETEFLSPHGVRSVSKTHERNPYVLRAGEQEFVVRYAPGESDTGLFGGNSNWRGPIWFPVNYLLVESLEKYSHFYGGELKVECPAGSGRQVTLQGAAREISERLARLFVPDASGKRPCHGEDRRYAEDPHFKDLVLFYEYFHGDTGRGVGASHQTGWTGLVAKLIEDLGKERPRTPSRS